MGNERKGFSELASRFVRRIESVFRPAPYEGMDHVQNQNDLWPESATVGAALHEEHGAFAEPIDLEDENERRCFRAAFAADAKLAQEIQAAIDSGVLDRIKHNVLAQHDTVMRVWRAEELAEKPLSEQTTFVEDVFRQSNIPSVLSDLPLRFRDEIEAKKEASIYIYIDK